MAILNHVLFDPATGQTVIGYLSGLTMVKGDRVPHQYCDRCSVRRDSTGWVELDRAVSNR